MIPDVRYHYGKSNIWETAIRKNVVNLFFKEKDELEPACIGSYETRQWLFSDAGWKWKQNFSIRTSADDLSGKLKYKDSKLNEEFIEYVDFVSSRRSEADSLQGVKVRNR